MKAESLVIAEGRGTRNRPPPRASSALWKRLFFPFTSEHVMTPTRHIPSGRVNPTEDFSEAHTLYSGLFEGYGNSLFILKEISSLLKCATVLVKVDWTEA